MRIYTPVLLAMACTTPAMAAPITWDYVATSCTPETTGASCGSNIVGSDVATFTVTPPADNNFSYTTFGPPSQSGSTDFSLTAFGFTAPPASNTCINNCAWTIGYDATDTSPGLTTIKYDDLFSALTYSPFSGWTESNGIYEVAVNGDWQEVGGGGNNPVPAPGSSLLWMFVMLWMFSVSCVLRKRV